MQIVRNLNCCRLVCKLRTWVCKLTAYLFLHIRPLGICKLYMISACSRYMLHFVNINLFYTKISETILIQNITNLHFLMKTLLKIMKNKILNQKYLVLYPPQRGYISFVNTFVTPRNNDLGPYVPWTLCSLETFDQRKILRHLSCVCLSARPSVVNTIASEHKELQT